MEIRMKYLKRDKDRHGNVRIYFVRPGARKVRIHAPEGSPAFFDEYHKAVTRPAESPGSKAVIHGSFAWLCNQYMASGEYQLLAKSSRDTRRRVMKNLCETHGHKPVNDLEARHIRSIRDERAKKPGAANQVVKVFKSMFKWAVDAGVLESNPAASVPKLRYQVSGFKPWTNEQLDAFEARHPEGSKARLAYSIMLYLGVRLSDAVKLGRQMEQNGSVRFRQTKTGKWLTLPIIPILRAEIDRHPDGMTYLLTSFGKPFTPDGFGNWFHDRIKEAGLSGVSAHGLRKTGATRAAMKGATIYELQAIFGWASAKEAEPYTKEVDQQKLASASIHKLERK